MVQFITKTLGATLLLASTVAAESCYTRELTYPEVIDADEISDANEALTLDIDWLEIDPGFSDAHGYQSENASEPVCGSTPFMTRALGGSVPGPTIKVSPGTTLKVRFRNKLTFQPESFSSRKILNNGLELLGEGSGYQVSMELDLSRLNKINDPDTSNLHFHGLHISGVLPSDDTTLEVLPQQEYEYTIQIPEDHEPGLHWVHPHHHGSSTLQLVGGAALAIIVKDPEAGFLPAEIQDAPERVMVFQDWDIPEAKQAARHGNDLLLMDSFSKIESGQSIGQRFVTVNGKYQPIAEIPVGKWERWRFLYAGWQDLPLDFGFIPEGNPAECEFYLLAKDGIYISDYPRGPMLTTGGKPLPIPPGGRADFMVRCNKVGETTRFEALSRRNIFLVNVVEGDSNSNSTSSSTETDATPEESGVALAQRSISPLTPWRKPEVYIPEYLQSVLDVYADDQCLCETKFDGYDDTSRVNGEIYRPGNRFMHTSYLGAVVERELKGMHEHSYHQHVYPYQLIAFPNRALEGNEYFRVGDWHDTYLDKEQKGGGAVTIRYKTTDIAGKIMVHCHNTLHADWGMIQKEYVRDVTEGRRCACDIFDGISGEGIIDDIETAKVIGAVQPPPVEDSSSTSAFVGFTQVVSVLLVVAGALLGPGW